MLPISPVKCNQSWLKRKNHFLMVLSFRRGNCHFQAKVFPSERPTPASRARLSQVKKFPITSWSGNPFCLSTSERTPFALPGAAAEMPSETDACTKVALIPFFSGFSSNSNAERKKKKTERISVCSVSHSIVGRRRRCSGVHLQTIMSHRRNITSDSSGGSLVELDPFYVLWVSDLCKLLLLHQQKQSGSRDKRMHLFSGAIQRGIPYMRVHVLVIRCAKSVKTKFAIKL